MKVKVDKMWGELQHARISDSALAIRQSHNVINYSKNFTYIIIYIKMATSVYHRMA
jgi:hypothetical protein